MFSKHSPLLNKSYFANDICYKIIDAFPPERIIHWIVSFWSRVRSSLTRVEALFGGSESSWTTAVVQGRRWDPRLIRGGSKNGGDSNGLQRYVLVQSARTKYPGLGGLYTTKIDFLQFVEAKIPRARRQHGWDLVRALCQVESRSSTLCHDL